MEPKDQETTLVSEYDQRAADVAKTKARTAQINHEMATSDDWNNVSIARAKAETDRTHAETARIKAETDRIKAETNQAEAHAEKPEASDAAAEVGPLHRRRQMKPLEIKIQSHGLMGLTITNKGAEVLTRAMGPGTPSIAPRGAAVQAWKVINQALFEPRNEPLFESEATHQITTIDELRELEDTLANHCRAAVLIKPERYIMHIHSPDGQAVKIAEYLEANRDKIPKAPGAVRNPYDPLAWIGFRSILAKDLATKTRGSGTDAYVDITQGQGSSLLDRVYQFDMLENAMDWKRQALAKELNEFIYEGIGDLFTRHPDLLEIEWGACGDEYVYPSDITATIEGAAGATEAVATWKETLQPVPTSLFVEAFGEDLKIGRAVNVTPVETAE